MGAVAEKSCYFLVILYTVKKKALCRDHVHLSDSDLISPTKLSDFHEIQNVSLQQFTEQACVCENRHSVIVILV